VLIKASDKVHHAMPCWALGLAWIVKLKKSVPGVQKAMVPNLFSFLN
jgi:hypothetical protein